MKVTEFIFQIGSTVIQGKNIISIHAESGKCAIKYWEKHSDGVGYEKICEILSMPMDVEIYPKEAWKTKTMEDSTCSHSKLS